MPNPKLSSHAISIAEDWFKSPIQTLSVTPLGPYSMTADGACPVTFGANNVAFVKPRPGPENKLMVAREKLAADLGFALGYPVAPVVVRTPQPSEWPNFTAMSLSCFQSPRHWDAAPQPDALNAAAEDLERLRVFWTWIADHDHNGHGQNLVYDVVNGAIQVAAIDHSYCLCHSCDPDNPTNVPACNGYGAPALPAADAARKQAANDIIANGMGVAKERVQLLTDILTFDEQSRILKILEGRLALLAPWAS